MALLADRLILACQRIILTLRFLGPCLLSSLLSMLFKLALCAETSFRRIKGFNWLAEVIRGVKFTDGVKQDQQLAAA